MAFGLDDTFLATAKEAVSDGVKEGMKVVKEETTSECSFNPKNFEYISSNNKINDSNISEHIQESPNSSLELDKNFSPDKFNESGDNGSEEALSETALPRQIERTSTFEEQTIDNFDLEARRPEIEDGMKLGYEHDCGVLRENMNNVMDTKSNQENSNAHHIVGRDTPESAKQLEEFGIDRNDPANGIFLPNSPESPLKGAVHGQGRHIADYSNEVEQRFANVTTREEALEVLQSLKEDLYNGNIAVHYDIEPNK